MSGRPARVVRIGLALGERSATAVTPGDGPGGSVAVPVHGPIDAGSLAAAFALLARRLGERLGRDTAGARVSVALLPPLSDARLVRLPPLKRAEAESVIRRDAARHFTGGAGARIVGVIRAGATGRGAPGADFLAAAAPAALVEAVRAGARAAGWQLDAVVAAHGAWLVARGSRPPARSRTVLAVVEDVVHVLRVEEGRCTAVRRAPADLPAEVLEAAGHAPGPAVIFADADRHHTLAESLARAGRAPDTSTFGTGAEAAAAGAAGSRLLLVPPSVVAERARRGRRNIMRTAAGALLLLAAGAAVELWGVRRELSAVQAERSAIRPEVAPLLATRDSIDRAGEEARAIRVRESGSPRWTRALFDLALLLPKDAYITSLHTTGDTIVVEATGARAGAALQALRKAGSLDDIRLVGTVERDLEDGATTAERFRFTARLRPLVQRDASRAAAPGAAGGSTGGSGSGP